MGTHDVTIRDALSSDADAMGHLHVRAWQRAYRGVMPDEYLDDLRADERVDMWRSVIAQSDRPLPLVACLADQPVGFAAYGAARSSVPTPSCGQLYAMNLDPDHWGRGIGRLLLQQVTLALAEMGFEEAVLWVVPENVRARALYESDGWRADGGRSTEEVLGVTVTDIRYRKSLSAPRPHTGQPTAP